MPNALLCVSIFAMDADLVQYLEGMENRLREYIDRRTQQQSRELTEYIDERTHDTKTRIVRAFVSAFASSNRMCRMSMRPLQNRWTPSSQSCWS